MFNIGDKVRVAQTIDSIHCFRDGTLGTVTAGVLAEDGGVYYYDVSSDPDNLELEWSATCVGDVSQIVAERDLTLLASS